MSKPIDKEVLLDDFMSTLQRLCHYWATLESDYTVQERMEGLVFSTLVIFDGGNGGLPAFDISALPHPVDKQYHIDEGKDWIEPGMVINDEVSLHDLWHQKYTKKK